MKQKRMYVLLGMLLFSTAVMAQEGQPGGDRPKPPGKEERLKHVSEKMEKELKLTAAQKAKVSDAYKTFFNEMEALRKKEGGPNQPPPPPPPPKDKAAVDKLVKERDAKVKSALNPTQYQQYVELEKTMRPPGPGGKQGPPPNGPKQ